MTIFALADCNNFYASCERAFNPYLEQFPVVVLSNNDGCIIARSREAKKLGIPMGAPFFKWEKICLKNKVKVFSSNYELYGDMSQRVMTLLAESCPDIEIYSIDEAFLLLDSFSKKDLTQFTIDIKDKIKRCTGLPISIGIGTTKTLAKLANAIAKSENTTGVLNICDPDLCEELLTDFPVEKIWGVGSQTTKRLQKLDIHTAKQLRDADPKRMRAHFSVVMEKTIQELKGISCITLEREGPRQQIISSRSFGRSVTKLEDLEEAISLYASIASSKLRKQKSVTAGLSVFLYTNPFHADEKQYDNGASFRFPIPTADTRYIIHAAKRCLKHIFKQGYLYHKAGIMLFDLRSDDIYQHDMFNSKNQKSETVMQTVDKINGIYGKQTVFYCAEGIKQDWKIKSRHLSKRYTTRWDELLEVKLSSLHQDDSLLGTL